MISQLWLLSPHSIFSWQGQPSWSLVQKAVGETEVKLRSFFSLSKQNEHKKWNYMNKCCATWPFSFQWFSGGFWLSNCSVICNRAPLSYPGLGTTLQCARAEKDTAPAPISPVRRARPDILHTTAKQFTTCHTTPACNSHFLSSNSASFFPSQKETHWPLQHS